MKKGILVKLVLREILESRARKVPRVYPENLDPRENKALLEKMAKTEHRDLRVHKDRKAIHSPMRILLRSN